MAAAQALISEYGADAAPHDAALAGRDPQPPSLFLRYDGCVGNARTCVVSFLDSGGIRHSVEVAAESLCEAAAFGVREFRQHCWIDAMEPDTATPLTINVKAPSTTHEVSIRQLERWVGSSAKSPKDTILRMRVPELLDQKPDAAVRASKQPHGD